jgi:2-dehydro-3-deoxy-D-arabinonate dehydratase
VRLRRCLDDAGASRWVLEARGETLAYDPAVGLAQLMRAGALEEFRTSPASVVETLAPVDPFTEVWAAGVTYERSLEARAEESALPDIYDAVYTSDRPELFMKAVGWRVSGPGQPIAVRADSAWNVPEPELAAVLDSTGAVFGWTVCNDVSSRSIEAVNPLYLPQAKVYLGGCALGPAIVLADAVPDPYALTMRLRIERDGRTRWSGESTTAKLRRTVDELAAALTFADVFPHGVVLATGTALVPDDEFTLEPGDVVHIGIDGIGELINPTVSGVVPDRDDRVARMEDALR